MTRPRRSGTSRVSPEPNASPKRGPARPRKKPSGRKEAARARFALATGAVGLFTVGWAWIGHTQAQSPESASAALETPPAIGELAQTMPSLDVSEMLSPAPVLPRIPTLTPLEPVPTLPPDLLAAALPTGSGSGTGAPKLANLPAARPLATMSDLPAMPEFAPLPDIPAPPPPPPRQRHHRSGGGGGGGGGGPSTGGS
ncbi:MAG: hypothetical protein GXP41_12800 [Chloroflexi bacterium]|nr:hypothetical protein [Chloroflexota bacterium]